MATLNVEIKASCSDPGETRRRLAALGAQTQGEDRQTDIYLRVPDGRLKLRQGDIENYLIHYSRADEPSPKDSLVTLYASNGDPAALLDVLTAALTVLVVVEKHRHISWIDNVKFHVDDVQGLGSFVEIEAIDRTGEIGRARLLAQCTAYVRELGIADADLEPLSYSDLLLART